MDNKQNDGASDAPQGPAGIEAVPTPPAPANGTTFTPQGNLPPDSAPKVQETSQPPHEIGTPYPGEVQPVGAIKSGSSKSKKLVVLLVALLVALLVGGYFVYALVLNSPEARLSRAVNNFITADEVASKLVLEAESDGISVNATVNSYVSYSPLSANFNIEVDLLASKLNFDIRYVEEAVYLRLNGLDEFKPLVSSYLSGFAYSSGLGNAQVAKLDRAVDKLISRIDGKWIEIQKSLIDSTGLDINDLIAQVKANADSLTLENDVLTIDQNLGSENVGDVSTLKLEVLLNKDGVVELYTKMLDGVEINGEPAPIEDMTADIEKSFEGDSLAAQVFTVWIDVSNDTFERIRAESTEEKNEMTITATYIDPSTVEKPTKPSNTMTLLELSNLVTEVTKDLGIDGSVLGAFDEIQ